MRGWCETGRRSLGLFRHPLGGMDRELAGVEAAIENLALAEGELSDDTVFADIVVAARAAHGRIQEAARHELHRDPFRPEMAEGPGRVPLDALLKDVDPDLEPIRVLGAAHDLLDAGPGQLCIDQASDLAGVVVYHVSPWPLRFRS